MKRRVFLGLAAGVSLASLLAGCAQDGPRYSYRFRMTVNVNTPEGIKSGSSVYEISAGKMRKILSEAKARDWTVKGEAVAVDLPNGQTLFALLKTGAHFGDMAGLSMAALDLKFKEKYDVVGSAKRLQERRDVKSQAIVPAMRSFKNRRGEMVEVPNYPMLVTFVDIKDPTSVQKVEADDLSASFGEGYALKSITIEITDEPVTTGIEKRLGWLGVHPEPRLDPDYKGSTNPNLAQRLWHGDFSRRTIK